jgi:hypothetical protein
MSIGQISLNGYYDETGHWQRTKFCFVSCGDHCDCGPPMGMYYNPAYDRNKEQEVKQDDAPTSDS